MTGHKVPTEVGSVHTVKLAPSVLSADFSRLKEQIEAVTQAGADYIHVDVMDGHFVPNLTMGPVVVEGIRASTHLPLDVHLMIEEPDRFISDFVHAGADHIIIHSEASLHLHRLIHQVKELGLRVGVAINPSTPLGAIEEVLAYVDVALVGTVNPGFAGQKLIPETLDKVARLKRTLRDAGYGAEIQVDGGINTETAPAAVRAGATVLVAGSAVFNKQETVGESMRKLKDSIRGLAGH